MVNKCSVTGCKSLYVKDNVKLHRFPLTNKETLPLWIAATGRQDGWKPCKSSRLCGNHFQKTEYIVGHGKGVLKSTAIPTIEYREEILRYNKKRKPKLNLDIQYNTEPLENDTHVEIVLFNFNDIYEHQNKDKNSNYNNSQGVPYNTNEYTEQNDQCHTSFNIKEVLNNEDNSTSHNETLETEYKCDNLNQEIKSDICNGENQCYMFTSSFKEGVEPIILPPPDDKTFEEPLSMNIDQSTADSSFNQIMALKLKRQRRTKDIYSLYFKSLKIKNPTTYNDDTASFGAFIEAQMKKLCPYKKLYLTTKHKIQKILMKAQLKITN